MQLDILDYKALETFPSGSGIEYYNGHIYLVGDDAKSILVTNKRWRKAKEISLFESKEKRIPKKLKADFEATAILNFDRTYFTDD